MTPDHVEAIHENTVYADNFAIEQAPTCDKALKLKEASSTTPRPPRTA